MAATVDVDGLFALSAPPFAMRPQATVSAAWPRRGPAEASESGGLISAALIRSSRALALRRGRCDQHLSTVSFVPERVSRSEAGNRIRRASSAEVILGVRDPVPACVAPP